MVKQNFIIYLVFNTINYYFTKYINRVVFIICFRITILLISKRNDISTYNNYMNTVGSKNHPSYTYQTYQVSYYLPHKITLQFLLLNSKF